MNFPNCIQCCATICNGLHRMARAARKQSRQLKEVKDAREEGKVAKSKELTAAFDLIVLFLVLKIFISFVGGNLIGLFSTVYKKMPDFLKESQEQISSVSVTHYLNNVILQFLLTVLPFLLSEL